MSKRNILIAAIALIAACAAGFIVLYEKEDIAQIPANTATEDVGKQQMLELNRQMIADEMSAIENYINEQPYKVSKSDEGYWYYIIDNGNGKPINRNDRVCLDYNVELLDGSLCYSSDTDGNKCFSVGQRQVEKGLDEAITDLYDKSEAVIILPSYLAHGATGDRNRIKPFTPIIYIVKVLSVE